MKEKSKKIDDLEKENFILKSSSSPDYARSLKEIAEERDSYKKQVTEMKEFLADYGLVWVGKDGANEGKFDSKQVNSEL